MVIDFEKSKAILQEKKEEDTRKLDEHYYRDQVQFFEKWYAEHDMYLDNNKVNRNR